MDYRKIIKNKETRFKILHYLRVIPDSWMVKFQYKIKMGRKLDLKNPKRYTEKLQWYKVYYRDPLLTKCADKYEVRKYIKLKGLNDILVDLYAVYEYPNQIKLDELPERFVIKTTNGSGTNILCKDKSTLSLDQIKSDIAVWLKRDNYAVGREWSYKGIKPKIIIEEYLEDNDNKFDGINDYKFLCFNGKPKYIVLDVDRNIGHKRNIYDVDWNYIDVSTDHENFGDVVPKPDGYEEMLKVAKILAEDFPFVRVDLYYVNMKVYFGELTFYPWTGYVQFEPDKFDYILGDELVLPNI
ncbi:ATP-grasp fold amidoligase family protein [Jeotgalibaca porci]|uniref:ATP-grasp fold amidoligase family protein n=1 Tax=Jeotgalibaca porci TaxID=1868793 RepID=UPI003F9218F5